MKRQAVTFGFLLLVFELSSSTVLRVVPGSRLDIPCLTFQTDFPGASITWRHDGNLLSKDTSGPAVVTEDGVFLSIPRISPSSKGQYECVLRLNDMELKHTYSLIVEGSVSYTITATAGASVNLMCRFPSNIQSETTALWFKETPSRPERSQLRPVEVASGDQRLEWQFLFDNEWSVTLRDTVVEDSGIYQCETAQGERFSTVHLQVEAAPTAAPHSCSGFDRPWETCQDGDKPTWEAMLRESVTEFSMKLFSHACKLQPSANMLISPLSISQTLYYLLLGARDDTRRNMETALFVPHGFHCVHHQTKRMREQLASSVQSATQIFYDRHMNLSQSFRDQSVQFYDSEPTTLLEDSEENVKMINSWVAQKTNDRISSLVSDVPSATQLLLLNAVAYKGLWKMKFDKNTEPQHFTKLNGDLVAVPVLYSLKYEAAMDFVADVMAKVVRLPLSGDTNLYILLPRYNTLSDLQTVEEKMTDATVRKMIRDLNSSSIEHVEITIPQIRLDVETNMVKLIKSLGLSSLFQNPNLCGLFPEDQVVLSDAKHKAFLALNEEGVEASAATSLAFSRSYPSFSALRPFILLLWSDAADMPLFMGRVTEP